MFAPKVAKPHTKAADSSTSNLARQRSTLVAHRPGHSSAEQALFLQRTIGNQATQRYLTNRLSNSTAKEIEQHESEVSRVSRKAPSSSWDFSKIPVFASDRVDRAQARSPHTALPLLGSIQPKLAMGQANDPLEHEADRVADQIVRMPDSELSAAPTLTQLSRKREAPAGERVAGTHGAPTSTVHDVLRATGQPLDGAIRAYFEPRFSHDFSRVRVHTDTKAADSASALGAAAYTVGNNIVFGPGRYAPTSSAGRHLLAHELAHTVQQAGSGPALQLDDAIPAGSFDVPTLDDLYNAALRTARRASIEQDAAKYWQEAGKYWQDAAKKLNGFNRADILERLVLLPPYEVGYLHQGALDDPEVGPNSQIAQMTQPGTPLASTPAPAASVQPAQPDANAAFRGQGRDALGTSVIADVASQQQQGLDFEAARRDAFGKLKLLLRADPSGAPPTAEDRKTAVATIAAAMAGLKAVKEPRMLSEGRGAHTLIGEHYAGFNKPTLLDPKIKHIIRALKLTPAAYNVLYQRLPEELLESLSVRPDIVDLGKMQVYEIKSFGARADALPEMEDYIELLESFKIPGIPASSFVFHPGSPSNKGTSGFLPGAKIGRGWIIFCCPLPEQLFTILLTSPKTPERPWSVLRTN